MRLCGTTRLATTAGILAAATAWAAPAAEAQVSWRGPGGPDALRAPLAPALLAEVRSVGATVTRPTFLLEVPRDWSHRPTAPRLGAAVHTGLESPDLAAELRYRPSPRPGAVTMLRQLPVTFGVDDVLDSFSSRRALHQVFPGLKSASRVFRLGGSIRF